MDVDSFLLGRGRLYAIGDIHGRSDLLDYMIAAICADLAAHPAEECLTDTRNGSTPNAGSDV